MVRLRWLEGKVGFALQEDAEAEAAFREARRDFLRQSQSFDAALVSLDLALVLAKHERRRELVVLVEGMIATFRRLKIRREGFAALILLRKVCQRPVFEAEALSARIRATVALLEQRSR
jgi:hypothetical protein